MFLTAMATSSFMAMFAVTAIACGAAPHDPQPTPRRAPRTDGGTDVTLTAADGVKLAATHWPGPGANERCVVLVHQVSSTREEWAPLVERLRGRYEILSFDLRGHGGSTRGPGGEISWRRFGEAEWRAGDRDLDAALAWLGERGFRAEDCALVGSSIGGSYVIRHAGEHGAASIVLLSPGLAYHGVTIAEAAARYGGPALVLHSEEDGAKDTAAELGRLWGDRMELVALGGTAHGVALVVDDAAMLDLVVGFVDRTLELGPDLSPGPCSSSTRSLWARNPSVRTSRNRLNFGSRMSFQQLMCSALGAASMGRVYPVSSRARPRGSRPGSSGSRGRGRS